MLVMLSRDIRISFQLPENKALEGLAGAMLESHKVYGQPKYVQFTL